MLSPINRISLVQGDITLEETDAIANAANTHLSGGGGVDGAIHRAGGAELKAELKKKFKGCPTGGAVITGGGHLKAKFVIHAVGPRYSGSGSDPMLLASAYESTLILCTEHHLRSISFPSISTGIYGYPLDEAVPIALKTVASYLKKHPDIEEVRFVLFDEKSYGAYHNALLEIEL